MDEQKRKREVRRQKVFERLGSDEPRCVVCGESDPHGLILEDHHIAGRVYDAATIIVCLNCHAKLSDAQKDHPKQIGAEPDPLERIAQFLLGLADIFVSLAIKLREFAEILIAEARARSQAMGA